MLKMISKTAAASLVLATIFTGCTSTEPKAPEESTFVDAEFQGAPQWVLSPFVEGAIADMGSAKRNAGNDFSFQREEAVADARNNLARQLDTKVSNMIKTYKASTSETYDKSIESVSKQIASQTLVGSKATKMWRSKTGTLYVLVVLNSEIVKDQMDKAIKTSFKNDKAMYQKFLASKAQGELDKELEKLEN
ncbi:LPP20 family lipoprotein [Poseidonibacter sp.]|uniref:LPP20 family lipoprotein n=1 Tax=Poseidonibacter sp. TaxID=2321188 RepID=UPI00359EB080